MIAVLSDIHANYEALLAVLDAIDAVKPEAIICLGDIVGYGPDPIACTDAVRQRCTVTICGNHDFGLIYGASHFSPAARESLEQHRALLMPRLGADNPDKEKLDRWNFLKGLPHRHVRGEMLFVHGAPRNPIVEYLRKIDVLLNADARIEENFRQVDWLCFVGHTHRAGIITSDVKYVDPADNGWTFTPNRRTKAIINVGSVGQSRDGDPRACFVTVEDDGVVNYHRVEYNMDATIAKMSVSPAGVALAERLRRAK
jgi:diadenosine tetraphosphatase ApaH/serine/threonine PP2A family protein phosphatase